MREHRKIVGHRGCAVLLAAALALGVVGAATAQGAASHGADEVKQKESPPEVAGGQGGVGGTGLGKMPPAGDALGTGNSVKGPAGQGITAPTVLEN